MQPRGKWVGYGIIGVLYVFWECCFTLGIFAGSLRFLFGVIIPPSFVSLPLSSYVPQCGSWEISLRHHDFCMKRWKRRWGYSLNLRCWDSSYPDCPS
ncbi:uncharacterized protein BDR25DRAFT_43525 [Lindgomyces ingoldianus]|uniref:Uncharacterized protein n=1 Tax=Lindgomyces ingoldianus TaxID=673940 RepID=A0ACB6RF08_9PLEO|nr:uncharacterized protein BDR25DRAFT_43525 [Lindgomyces ingoldianus]KAF2477066.1 hypothetical protein BDR25DRAFT_43525 [Lindgomyces ingoldianus]